MDNTHRPILATGDRVYIPTRGVAGDLIGMYYYHDMQDTCYCVRLDDGTLAKRFSRDRDVVPVEYTTLPRVGDAIPMELLAPLRAEAVSA